MNKQCGLTGYTFDTSTSCLQEIARRSKSQEHKGCCRSPGSRKVGCVIRRTVDSTEYADRLLAESFGGSSKTCLAYWGRGRSRCMHWLGVDLNKVPRVSQRTCTCVMLILLFGSACDCWMSACPGFLPSFIAPPMALGISQSVSSVIFPILGNSP